MYVLETFGNEKKNTFLDYEQGDQKEIFKNHKKKSNKILKKNIGKYVYKILYVLETFGNEKENTLLNYEQGYQRNIQKSKEKNLQNFRKKILKINI